MKICYIFGAADGLPKSINIKSNDIVIAADAGLENAEKLGINPDVMVGDFDSLGFVPDSEEIIKHPVMKDDTDMLLAVKIGFEKGFKRFVIFGGTGKRPDHTFANVQTLNYIAEKGGMGFLSFGDYTATIIKNDEIKFKSTSEGDISVFSFDEKSKGINISGLLYKLCDADLSYSFPLGVSNQFMGMDSKISVSDGTLLIFWHGDADSIA